MSEAGVHDGALAPPGTGRVPLCVDMDGTLVRTDLLVESILRLIRQRPWSLLQLPFWLLRGRAVLKREVAARVEIDPSCLPYNGELIARIKEEHAAGRRLLLVTASDEKPARSVADHVGLFDEVIASDGRDNLKGVRKRDHLVETFGKRGFDYAGNGSADLPVWGAARRALAVNAPARVVARIDNLDGEVLDVPRSRVVQAIQLIRPRHWVKNLLVFAPILLAHRALDVGPLLAALQAFAAFSLGASAIYVLNDLLDVEADRHHPVKRDRPFASGNLPLAAGFVLFPALGFGSLVLGALLPASFLVALAAYFVLTTLYSFRLKQLALIDVLVLASLYTLRILAGSAATDVEISPWLGGFAVFIFLSLGTVKRYAELRRLREQQGREATMHGRGYLPIDLELLVLMGFSSGYIAALVLALFISSEDVALLYERPNLLWLLCPLFLYWISRIWLLAHRGELREDPVMFALRDRTTWAVCLIGAALLITASGGVGPFRL